MPWRGFFCSLSETFISPQQNFFLLPCSQALELNGEIKMKQVPAGRWIGIHPLLTYSLSISFDTLGTSSHGFVRLLLFFLFLKKPWKYFCSCGAIHLGSTLRPFVNWVSEHCCEGGKLPEFVGDSWEGGGWISLPKPHSSDKGAPAGAGGWSPLALCRRIYLPLQQISVFGW